MQHKGIKGSLLTWSYSSGRLGEMGNTGKGADSGNQEFGEQEIGFEHVKCVRPISSQSWEDSQI